LVPVDFSEFFFLFVEAADQFYASSRQRFARDIIYVDV
jgi:hypothetical protein